MAQYSRKEIDSILQIDYYDRRTDYMWKSVVGESPELENTRFPIGNLLDFQVMHSMQKKRKLSIEAFLDEWETSEHPGLTDCLYQKRSGKLTIKARSFDFTYNTKIFQCHFVVHSYIARSIGLLDRLFIERYRNDGMFRLSDLCELDHQLYSRYAENEKIWEWRQSPQYEKDLQYCEAMVPFLMQNADDKARQLGRDKRLNIILSRDDEVRIGIVRDYSPDEMISMPCYPRADWQEGIQSAFAELNKEYSAALQQHTIKMQQWSDELANIARRTAPYFIQKERPKVHTINEDHSYSQEMLDEALGKEVQSRNMNHPLDLSFLFNSFPETDLDIDPRQDFTFKYFHIDFDLEGKKAIITLKEEIATALHYDIKNETRIPARKKKISSTMMEMFDSNLERSYNDLLLTEERKKRPQHQLLVEEIKYIIEQTAPLIYYSGPDSLIKDNYSLYIKVEDNDSITVKVPLSGFEAKGSFRLDSYQSKFRIWWSQQLLRECKIAKQHALDPTSGNPFELDF